MPKKNPQSKVTVEELEPRILFSAGGLESDAIVGLAGQSLERVLNVNELPQTAAAEQQPIKQTVSSQLAFARANSSVLSSTYYLDDIDGLSDKPVGDLKTAVPTDTVLVDYDGSSGEDGLQINKGGSGVNEADSALYQTWLVDASGETLQGAVNLNIWSAMKGFATGNGGRVDVFLVDSDFTGTNLTLIASDSIERADWDLSDSATWIEDTFDFGNVNYTFGAGRHLGIKIIVHSSSEDNMMFAYDTTTHAARLTVSPAINTVVVDTAIDENDGDTSSISALIANPGGAGISLREAIEAANATANGASPDRIHFEIPGTPALALNSDLPAIVDAVVIDGTTDSDYATNMTPVIELDGQGILNIGLQLTGDNTTIRGLAVNNFDSHGIHISGNSHRIESSYIGISTDGINASANAGLGIRIDNGQNNQIGAPGAGNVVSGNALTGIGISGAGSSNNIIESNRIGTNANGTAAVPNGNYGIDLWNGGANSNRIGGDSLAQRNVISGNDWAGVHISGGSNNIVSGNYIGGNAKVAGEGVSNNGGVDIDGDSSDNQIGGTNGDEGNIIAFNTGEGVKVSGSTSDRNSIQRNLIYDNSAQGIALLSNGNDNRMAAQLDNAEHNAAGNILIQGSYSDASIANQTISLEYFSTSSSAMQGESYLATETLTLDGTGYADIEHILSASINTGEFVTATVTDAAGNTSEFSLSPAASLNQAPVFESSGPFAVDEGATISTVVGDVNANDGDGGATDADVAYSITANVNPDGDASMAFGIDTDSGEIIVNDPGDLDFENTPSLTITVQVDDGLNTSTIDVTINLSDVKPTLTATGAGATSAGQPYQLDLVAVEPGSNSISSYTVNWGDGTVTTEIYAGPTTSVTHVYNNHGFTNEVTFTANEASGGVTASELVSLNYVPSADDLYLVDGVSGDTLGTFASTSGVLDKPYGISVGPDGNFYVAGETSENIVRFAPDGSYLDVFTSDSRLNSPAGLTWGSDGNLYVANYGGNNILRFQPDGQFFDVWSDTGSLNGPVDLDFGPDSDLYVSSWDNHQIVRIDGVSGGASNTVLNAGDGLKRPEQIEFGENGDLFIANGEQNDVLRWDGTTTTSYFSHADLDLAVGLAFGPDGQLYVASHENDKLLRYDGSSGQVFADDGPGGLESPSMLLFTPAHQVTVGPNDPPTANNLSASENYIEETTLNLSNIIVSDSDNSTTTATLTLSDLAAGQLSTSTSGSVSSTFDPGTGVWSASGAIADVNVLLVNVSYVPAENYDRGFNIATTVSDGIAAPLTGTKVFTATPINDRPQLTSNSLTLSEGEVVTLDSSNLSATDVDNINDNLTFNFSSISGGFFELSSAPGVAVSSATQLQVSTSQLRFVHDGGESAPAYRVSVSDGALSTSPSAATITFANTNDVPRIDHLDGNASVAINDGSLLLIDTDVPASVFDADLPINIDGAMLSVQGLGFDGQDKVVIAEDSSVTLSSGMTNGSRLAVSGNVVATLSSVTATGFLLNFSSQASTADADAIMARLAFSSTATLFGNRDIEVFYSDGIVGSNISTVSVLVTSSNGGDVQGNEDQSYTFTRADFDFTGVLGNNLESITILSLPLDGELSLSDSAVSVGQTITAAEISSGALQFMPALDANGNDYAEFDFHVNNGIVSTNVLAGPIGSIETLQILQESSNFGLGGVYPTDVNIVSPSGQIDGNYLAQGSILFDSEINDIGWTNDQLALLDSWVRSGGVLIASSDNTDLDDIANFYGLVIGGSAANTWNVALSSDPIFNGRFGPVGPNGTVLSTGGATASYFLESSLDPAGNDTVLARDSVSGEPTIVLRQLDQGWILFTGDENVFDTAMTGGGAVNTINDRFSANVFDWAIDQLPASETHTLSISIAAVNDPPTVSNINAAESYTEDTPLDLIDMLVSDVDSGVVNVKLLLSTPSAGILSTGTLGSASSTYNAVTGEWLANGSPSDVSTLLANLVFTPSENFEQDFTLQVEINDGTVPPISGSKQFTAIAVNDPPVADAGGPYAIVEGDGISFDSSGSFDGDASDSLQALQWDLLKDGNVLASDVGSVLNWSQLASHGVNDDGSYQVRLTVTDGSGVNNSALSALSVADRVPVFDIAGPAIAYQDAPYELTLEFTDPGEDPVTQWLVDWGDGTVQSIPGSETSANHVYTVGGITPTISVVADTDEGQFAAANLGISVIPNAAPVGQVLIDNTSPIEEDVLTVSNTLADDDGLSGVISYQWLRDGSVIDGAIESSYVVSADDIGAQLSVLASYVDDRNTPETVSSEATQAVQPKNRAASLALESESIEIEENDTSLQRIRLSAITINDDGLGENTLSLSGDDADKFEIIDNVLYLKAGVVLDYEQATRFDVQVNVDDPAVDGSPDDSITFTLNVGDVAQEFFVPPEEVESVTPTEKVEEERDSESVNEEQVTPLEFIEEEATTVERGELPGGTRSSFQEQAIDLSGLISAIDVDQSATGVFPERTDASANALLVNLADVIDLDSVDVRFAAVTLLGELPGVDPMEDFSLLDNSSFTSGLDELRRGVQSIDLSDKIIVGSSATVTTGLSIGYVLWMIRGSVLLSTILSSLPAWRLIDPLPVISGMLSEEEDDESLESIIEDSSEPDPEPVDENTDLPEHGT